MDVKRIRAAANWNATAEALSGRDCDVRFEQPSRQGVDGLFWRLNDTAVIQLSPDIPEDQLMRVFLHEAAHALHDFDRYTIHRSERPARAAKPYTKNHLQRPVVSRSETRAERQAREWLAACDGCSSLMGKHIALMILAHS